MTLFCHHWSDKLLREVILQVSKAIERGQPMSSLLRSVQYSLKFLFEPMVLKLMKSMFSNFSLLTISSSLTGPNKFLYEKFITLTLVAVVPAPKASIISIANLQQNEEQIMIDLSRNYPPCLPLFDSIEHELESCALKIRATTYKRSEFLSLMEAEVKSRVPLANVLQFIDTNDVFLQAFRDDLIQRTFSLKIIFLRYPILLREIVRLLSGGSCLAAFCLSSMYEEFFSNLSLFFGPILKIKNPVSKTAEEFGDLVRSVCVPGRGVTPDAIIFALAAFNLDATWSLLLRVLTKEASTEELKQFVKALSLITNMDQIGSIVQHPSDKNNLHKKLQVLHMVYAVTLLRESVPFADLHDELAGSHLLSLITECIEVKVPSQGMALDLGNKLIKTFKFSDEEQITFAQDIFGSLLRSDSVAMQSKTVPPGLKQNIGLFLRLCAGKYEEVQYPIRNILPKIDFGWYLSQLITLLSHRPWRKDLLDLINSILTSLQKNRFKPCLFSATNTKLIVVGQNIEQWQSQARYETRLHQLMFQAILHEQSSISKDIISLMAEYEAHRKNQTPTSQISISVTSFYVIKFIASKLSADGAKSAIEVLLTEVQKEKKTLDLIKEIMKSEAIVCPYLTLLSSIRTQGSLAILLSDKEAREALEIPDWGVHARAEKSSHVPAFEFMLVVKAKTPLGEKYLKTQSICRKTTAINELNTEINQSRAVWDYRLTILCVLYYQYFNEGQRHQDLYQAFTTQSALSQSLNLTKEEAQVFAFFANGPRPKAEIVDASLDFYPMLCEGRETRALHTCHVMFNMLAICLSMPPDTTPFYNRALYPERMSPYVPGSAFSHHNYDCGFKSEAGVLQPSNIMGGNVIHRLALNFAVWGSLTWSGVFRTEGEHFLRAVTDRSKLQLNYVGEDATAQKRAGMKIISETQSHRTYIFSRAATFLDDLCLNQQVTTRGLHVHEYLTHAFFFLREGVLDACAKGGSKYRFPFLPLSPILGSVCRHVSLAHR